MFLNFSRRSLAVASGPDLIGRIDSLCRTSTFVPLTIQMSRYNLPERFRFRPAEGIGLRGSGKFQIVFEQLSRFQILFDCY